MLLGYAVFKSSYWATAHVIFNSPYIATINIAQKPINICLKYDVLLTVQIWNDLVIGQQSAEKSKYNNYPNIASLKRIFNRAIKEPESLRGIRIGNGIAKFPTVPIPTWDTSWQRFKTAKVTKYTTKLRKVKRQNLFSSAWLEFVAYCDTLQYLSMLLSRHL